MSKSATILPFPSQNAIDRGIVVSFIQNASSTGRANANAIPSSGASELRPERPRCWSSCEYATSTFSVAGPPGAWITTFGGGTAHGDVLPHARSSISTTATALVLGMPRGILPQMGGRIVVGVDGSRESLAALRWAGEEARIRDATVIAVTAWENSNVATLGTPGGLASPDLSAELKRGAEEVQQAALRDAGLDPTDVQSAIVEGGAARVLLEAARGADLLVVGSRGIGGFRELVLGSVSQQAAHHADCPVVIVRGAEAT
jgi:nucleotide-binding universal stress UspA family protein